MNRIALTLVSEPITSNPVTSLEPCSSVRPINC